MRPRPFLLLGREVANLPALPLPDQVLIAAVLTVLGPAPSTGQAEATPPVTCGCLSVVGGSCAAGEYWWTTWRRSQRDLSDSLDYRNNWLVGWLLRQTYLLKPLSKATISCRVSWKPLEGECSGRFRISFSENRIFRAVPRPWVWREKPHTMTQSLDKCNSSKAWVCVFLWIILKKIYARIKTRNFPFNVLPTQGLHQNTNTHCFVQIKFLMMCDSAYL